MAGHSRWAQIKHKKTLTDAKKGKIFSKISRLITVAAKEKGADAATNPKLRLAIEKARAVGMPKDNVERAVARASSAGSAENVEEVRYEAYGPGGSAFLIFGVSDNKNRTTNEIKHILSEYEGKLADPGSVDWMFEKYGAVDLPKDKNSYSAEELSLFLIDAGARDVKEYEESVTGFTDPGALESLVKELSRRGLVFDVPYTDYQPKNPVGLSGKNLEGFKKIYEALEEHDDVQDVYSNVE